MISSEIDKLHSKLCPELKLPSSIEGKPLTKADMHVHTFYSKEEIPGGKNKYYGYEKITNFGIRLLYLYRKFFTKMKFKLPDMQKYGIYFHLPYSPKQVFDSAIKAGMDFVPLTDHNTIEGALWLINNYPATKKRVIVGEEVSSFLDKKREIHLGIYGLNKKHHDEIQAKKQSARHLVRYLQSHGIVFSLNHITGYIWGQFRPISQDEIRQGMELFDIMEVRNGIMGESNNKVSEILAKIYNKGMIAGTDSHSLRVGETYTAAYAKTKEDFLEQIRQKKSHVFGKHGNLSIMGRELVDKFSNYKNLFIDGKRLFPEGTWFHEFVFEKIGKRSTLKLNDFIGTTLENENVKSVFRYIKKNSGLF